MQLTSLTAYDLFESLSLLDVVYPDFDVAIVENMPGWRWRIAGSTIFLNGGIPVGPAGTRLIECVSRIVAQSVDDLIAAESPQPVLLEEYRSRRGK